MSYITLGKHTEANSLGWWGIATRRMTMGRAELHGNSQKKLFSLHFSTPITPSNAQFKKFYLVCCNQICCVHMNDDGCAVSSPFITLFWRENARPSFVPDWLLSHIWICLKEKSMASQILIFKKHANKVQLNKKKKNSGNFLNLSDFSLF